MVIGETARLGDDVIIMQGVTLGGNGKERGDRHPKLGKSRLLSLIVSYLKVKHQHACIHHITGSGVLVAAGSTVLGNIAIGDGVIISAVSVCACMLD